MKTLKSIRMIGELLLISAALISPLILDLIKRP